VNKSEIRKKIFKIRKEKNFRNLIIDFQNIIRIIKKAKNSGKIIGGYYPYNYEIDVIKILEKLEKLNYLITLPKIKKNFQMNFFRWSVKDPLSINEYGIPEPVTNKSEYPDILLVPIVAYDKNLNRVGYGGGFYDRYINKINRRKKTIKIGLAYSFQEVKKISTNKYDMKLDFIVTEKGFFE
tara:strand:- start:43 stop:588 length:546 start_codon:yes stop_codon:yes gene_type:complete